MNAKLTIAAIAAIAATLLGATSAFAAETPAQAQATPQAAPAQQADSKPVLLASAATTATAAGAAGATVAAAAATPPAAKPAGRTRAEVRAEAAEAVRNHRSTMSQHYDLLK